MTRGRHPFGDRFERDGNIVKNQKDLSLVEFIPEAEDLISCLLNPDPDQRYIILIQWNPLICYDLAVKISLDLIWLYHLNSTLFP